MSSDLKAVPTPVEPEATTRLTISKDQAMSLKIGLGVRFEVVGEVKELTQCYNDKEQYDVFLAHPAVKNATPTEDEKKSSEDDKKESLATIPKEELKKLISKEF